jgi:starch phosphorylase
LRGWSGFDEIPEVSKHDDNPAAPAREQVPSRRSGAAEVAYFTMEVALESALPTYSGGLGVLAGDYLRSAADAGLPLVAVTLLYRDGYFRQRVDAAGHQSEEPVVWRPADMLEPLDASTSVEVEIGGRTVRARAWRYRIVGVTGAQVPVYFLDSDVEANTDEDRALTDRLYGGDDRHRLAQEALLGVGGVDLLRALGHSGVTTFHMNEGHSSLLTLRLLELELERERDLGKDREGTLAAAASSVRSRCAFTTHTPVPAGHDRFRAELVSETLGEGRAGLLGELGLLASGELNMTELGVELSRYVNAVSRRHRDVAQAMLPAVDVRSVTNGVHTATWASPAMARLFDERIAGWRRDSSMLRYAGYIPLDEISDAHGLAKAELIAEVGRRTGAQLDPAALTVGLARRITPYKQTTLLFSDLDRLRDIAKSAGPFQVVCAGKAHPKDGLGKEMLELLVGAADQLAGDVSVVFVENYDLDVAALLCAGCDLWLNNPSKPNEASGTSGMKAALNGVPSLSVLDGWWIEGWVEGVTGWAIGGLNEDETPPAALYDKLEDPVLAMYYGNPDGYAAIRRSAIALNGSFFATDRMVREYAVGAYRL